MPPKKSQGFDPMKYWQVLVAAVLVLGGWFKMQGNVEAGQKRDEATDKRIEKVEDNQDQLYANSVEQKVQTAQMSQKLDLLIEYIKENKK